MKKKIKKDTVADIHHVLKQAMHDINFIPKAFRHKVWRFPWQVPTKTISSKDFFAIEYATYPQIKLNTKHKLNAIIYLYGQETYENASQYLINHAKTSMIVNSAFMWVTAGVTALDLLVIVASICIWETTLLPMSLLLLAVLIFNYKQCCKTIYRQIARQALLQSNLDNI